ncbi:hypothetical protein NDU88_005235 [Pleurodeles waltl]|uniref:Uncharacterized protein n=1 Tax=Pleurodeles waltl TaxID=8319 RepID=A0AAV7L261_PLEWA|nr:hypothetical protein NDU88_005235 [Pleurodeles waltl]
MPRPPNETKLENVRGWISCLVVARDVALSLAVVTACAPTYGDAADVGTTPPCSQGLREIHTHLPTETPLSGPPRDSLRRRRRCAHHPAPLSGPPRDSHAPTYVDAADVRTTPPRSQGLREIHTHLPTETPPRSQGLRGIQVHLPTETPQMCARKHPVRSQGLREIQMHVSSYFISQSTAGVGYGRAHAVSLT